MSEQMESQSPAPQEPVGLSEESHGEDQLQHGGNNGAQRGGRGRGGQQRGGRYGSNKYNHGNNGNQYNRYNGGNMGGNGRNYHNNGYKPHRGNMNAAAAAAAMNMQWPGYYNPQMYFMPPQMSNASNGPTGEVSPSSSPVSSASGTPAPAIKKIEITTKTGEHLDLNAMHHTHHPVPQSAYPRTGSIPGSEELEKPEAEVSVPATPKESVGASVSNEKSEGNSSSESGISKAEKTRREFLEQIKLRKAALEKKKNEQIQASKPKPTAPATEEKQPVVAEKPKEAVPEKEHEEVAAKEGAEAQKPAAVPVSEKPVTTFAESLKLKKEAAKTKADLEAKKDNVTSNVDAESFKPEAEAPKAEVEVPKAEVEAPKAEVEAPKAEVEAPQEDVDAPKAEVEAPQEETEAPKAEVEAPQEKVEAPQEEVEAPKVDVEAPKAEVEAPKVDVEAPKAEVEAPKAEIETSKAEVETPKAEVEVPKTEVEAPKAEVGNAEREQNTEEEEAVEKNDVVQPLHEEQQLNAETEAKAKEAEAGTETAEKEQGESEEASTEEAADSEKKMSVTQFLEIVNSAKPIEDIFAFQYPSGVEVPDVRYKKSHIKYTYGPTFLLQFKDKIKTSADEEWVQKAASKIVIPPSMNKSGRPRDPSLFGGAGRMGSANDFRKSGSMRGMDGRSGSRNSSKRKSKRVMDDRRSNRSYTSRRDRERDHDDRRDDDRPKEDVAPLIPSANRWVPKSRAKATEKKFAPDGVTEMLDKETAERKMKSLLNKLTLEMFDTISSDILKIANQSKWETQGETLKVVIEEVFSKACDEPHWSSMYAQLCGKLVKDLDPEISDEENEGKTGPKLVLHYLVARCHAEFEKGWSDKLPTKEDGSPLEPEMMSDQYYKAAAAKRRGLGLVRLIGYLYRLNLLTGKMMFECFRRLMKDLSNTPSEETLESVIELLNTVGQQFETDSFSAGQLTLEGSALLDSLFSILQNIIETAPISNRMKFKLVDIRELREDKHWNSNKKEDGPKTIQQIHDEEERQRALKNNSRSNSRRMNSSMGSRNSFRREAPSVSKDNFISTRSNSQRHTQKPAPKEEPLKPQKSALNMFSALMDNDDDE